MLDITVKGFTWKLSMAILTLAPPADLTAAWIVVRFFPAPLRGSVGYWQLVLQAEN